MPLNRRFLPIKLHYFFFLGAVSPILPFLMVVGKQLGIPVIFIGTIGAIILLLSVLLKPLVGSAADAFPKARKGIFIGLVSIMVGSLLGIDLLPRLYGDNSEISLSLPSNYTVEENSSKLDRFLQLYSEKEQISECYVDEAWDCVVVCSNDTTCNAGKISTLSYNMNLSLKNGQDVYDVGANTLELIEADSIFRLLCVGSVYAGDSCPSLWTYGVFWLFISLFTIGNLGFAIGNSITDAICVDLVGKDGDYGSQRAWGTVGWGLMGPISGLLIDWSSGSNIEKDYTPAFLILLAMGVTDIFVITAKLKVLRFKADSGVWSTVLPLLKKPHLIAFFFFAVFNGAFDGIVASYVFLMQEDMAKGTPYMQYMKFIQGSTLFIQCAIEAPFMWIYSWFDNKLGARRVTSLVFFLYMFRLFGLALVGSYGPVWGTLITELLNGPCYGLGYTALVVYAGQVSPRGTSATMQSIANLCYESFGYALASFLGGILYTHLGGPGIYYVFGAMAVGIFLLHFLMLFVIKQETYSSTEETPTEEDKMASNSKLDKKDEIKEKEAIPLQPDENKP